MMSMKALGALAISLGFAGITGMVEYLLNANAPLSKPVFIHAGLAGVGVMIALARQSFITPPAPPAPEPPVVH